MVPHITHHMLMLGLMGVYISSSLIGVGKGSQGLIRLSSLVCIMYLINTIPMYGGSIGLMDGTIRWNESNLMGMIGITTLCIVIILSSRLDRSYIILSQLIGAELLLTSNDMVVTYTAWELYNLSIYLLVCGRGAIKYFLLSAVITTFLLMGISLIYGLTGSTNYDGITMIYGEEARLGSIPLIDLIILVAIVFKLGGAPLHNWAPDLYDNLDTSITLWMMLIPKITILYFIIQLPISMGHTLIWVAILSLLVGSIGLGSQWRIKRFLAYSGISHIGFMLMAYSLDDLISYYIYILIYCVTIMCILLILIYSGMHNVNALYLIFGLAFFSLAGFPPLAGFYGKLLILYDILAQGRYMIAILVIFTSIISATNYLSLIRTTIPNSTKCHTIPYHIAVILTFLTIYSLLLPFNMAYIAL